MTISKEVLNALLSGVENADDLLGDQGLMKQLKVRLMERILGAELTDHLDYEPDAEPPNQQNNRRNSTTPKTLKCNDGALSVDVPRDKDGSFEPELIKKGQTQIDGMDDKIILCPEGDCRAICREGVFIPPDYRPAISELTSKRSMA